MSTLSSPARFGDLIAPTIEEDARAYLGAALLDVRRSFGDFVGQSASHVIAALGQADGMQRFELEREIAHVLGIGLSAPVLAVQELATRSVVEIREGRVYLNPALTEAIVREIFR